MSPDKPKNAAAVALGRLGGLRGGVACAAKYTAAERSERARRAAVARWAKVRRDREEKRDDLRD